MNGPKLGQENFNAMIKALQYIKANPGCKRIDIKKEIDKHKKCLRDLKFVQNGRAHYMNYQNILICIKENEFVQYVATSKCIHHFLTEDGESFLKCLYIKKK